MGTPTLRAPTAIAVTGLRKSYGEHMVLDGIDLTVQQGTVFALLGPNGAGKTTTVQILSTLIHADGGQATLTGYDLNREPAVEEADQLAHQIAVLDHGTLIAQGTPDQLKRMIPGGHIQLRFTDADTLSKAQAVIARPGRADVEALTLEVPTGGGVPELRGILTRLDDHGIDAAELTVHTPDLDDVFLSLTGD
jgi:ABC-type multidrug transport system ATPase subunit